jgi:hypothetical protein
VQETTQLSDKEGVHAESSSVVWLPSPSFLRILYQSAKNPSTVVFLKTLDAFSGNKLTRRDDLGTLIELATLHHHTAELEKLAFESKFIAKTWGIMQRIGKGVEGYERLAKELADALDRTRALISLLCAHAPAAIQEHLSSLYLTMTPGSLQNLLSLCYDLSWYKNWLIDNTKEHPD